MEVDFLIDNADHVYTCRGPAPRRGAAQREAGVLEHASVASYRGHIVSIGGARDVRQKITLTPGASVLNGACCTVVPGFVDPHTHVLFAGDRRDELQRRLAGATYAEIAADGGGILKTVAATRAATEEELVATALP